MTDKTAIDFSKCIQTIDSIGSKTYVNICDGTRQILEWGSADWLGFLGLVTVSVLFICVFGAFVFTMVIDR